MRAVSNTSPLANLAVIGRLDLLRHRYGAKTELLRLRTDAGFFIDAGIEKFMLSQAGE